MARVFLIWLAAALVPAAAGAVNVTLAGPTAGPLTSGVGSEDATALAQITFTVGLESTTSITGYDLTVGWDSTELDLVSAAQLFAQPSGPAFLETPVGGSSTGTSVSAFVISASNISATTLFSLTFDVLSLIDDGAADVRVWRDQAENGPGLSGLGMPFPTVDNINGEANAVGIDVVPEPTTALLLGLGLAVLGNGRKRR